jgi:hypothetical protein
MQALRLLIPRPEGACTATIIGTRMPPFRKIL